MAEKDKDSEDKDIQSIRENAAPPFDVLVIDASGFFHVRNPLVLASLASELVTTDMVINELRDESIAMLDQLRIRVIDVNEKDIKRMQMASHNPRLSNADLSILAAIKLVKKGRTGLLSDDVELIRTAKRLFNVEEVVVFLRSTRGERR
ncbi:MAG: hypothetical protein ACP5NY_03315 [Thermocladium sp.]